MRASDEQPRAHARVAHRPDGGSCTAGGDAPHPRRSRTTGTLSTLSPPALSLACSPLCLCRRPLTTPSVSWRPHYRWQALAALVAPPCALLSASLARLPLAVPGPQLAQMLRADAEGVATQVALVAASIRYCDRFRPERHPVLPVLEGGCWELLMRVADVFRGQAVVVQAMCELYSILISTMQSILLPLLPQVPLVVITPCVTSDVRASRLPSTDRLAASASAAAWLARRGLHDNPRRRLPHHTARCHRAVRRGAHACTCRVPNAACHMPRATSTCRMSRTTFAQLRQGGR